MDFIFVSHLIQCFVKFSSSIIGRAMYFLCKGGSQIKNSVWFWSYNELLGTFCVNYTNLKSYISRKIRRILDNTPPNCPVLSVGTLRLKY